MMTVYYFVAFFDGYITLATNVFSFISLFVVLFTSILSILIILKSLITAEIHINDFLILSSRISRSIDTFLIFLYKGSQKDTSRFENEIYLGNMNNPIHILIISNLYCKPRREHFLKLKELFLSQPNLYCIIVRFKVSSKDFDRNPSTGQYLIEYWNLKIKGQPDQFDKTLNYLNDWFTVKELDQFKILYPLPDSIGFEIGRSVDKMQQDWSHIEEVYRTPLSFINEYLIRNNYTVEDLNVISSDLGCLFSIIPSTMSHKTHNDAFGGVVGFYSD